MSEKKEMSAEEVLKKFDQESDKMEYKGFMKKFISAVAITFSVFQIYTASFGILDAQLQRAIHLGFGLALSFLLYPAKKSWRRDKLHPLDAIYGAQDEKFDKSQKLNSLATKFGVRGAFKITKILHCLSILSLILCGIILNLGGIYFLGVGIAAGTLIYQHGIVKPNDFSQVTQKYFLRNGIVSISLLIFTWLDYLFWKLKIFLIIELELKYCTANFFMILFSEFKSDLSLIFWNKVFGKFRRV